MKLTVACSPELGVKAMKEETKFVYFAPGSIERARVVTQNIVSFCEAMSNLGVDVELVSMGVRLLNFETRAKEPLKLYRIKNFFHYSIVMTKLHQNSNRYLWSLSRVWVHAKKAMAILNIEGYRKKIIFYTRNYSSVPVYILSELLTRKKPILVLEVHRLPVSLYQELILKKTDYIVANSFALGRDLIKQYPLLSKQIISIHQGVNLKLYDETRMSKLEARERLGLPVDKKLAVYTGKVYWGYKEIEYCLNAAQLLGNDVEVVIVGGRKDHVEKIREFVWRTHLTNVRLVGFVPPSSVQYYQFAADVLLLYYPSGIDLNDYRSPGKLFEYMASGRPIVAVDLPVLREVLQSAAIFVPPDSAELLAKAIREVLVDEKKATALATLALANVVNYTWDRRAKKILEFIGAANCKVVHI